ncbi:MAG: SDR family NAD(P)-dependent oxidoreductase, partial [Myxococcota bacterium]
VYGSVSVDVCDRDAVAEAAREALAQLGGLDVLIVNQGYALTGYIQDMPDEAFDEMIDVNFRGHVNVTRAFLPHFIEQRGGHICLVSSMLGFFGFFGYSAYAASKHAIAGFARCLRNELVPHGVKVTLVYPPTTDTPGLEKENQDKPPETWAIEGNSTCFSPEEVAASMLKGVAKGRFEVVPGFSSWAIWLAHRIAPSVTEWFIDQDLLRFTRKRAKS